MGWKKTLRSMGASARRSERNAQRRRRALEVQSKQLEKMQELERATYEVEVYENHIELLQSVHKECSDTWDWVAIKFAGPPASPERMHTHEELAQSALDEFKPGPLDKLLRRVDSKRDKLGQALDNAKRAKLDFETIDPSDSMRNFVHRMTFGKTKGFQAIEVINFSDLGLE